MEGEQKHTVRYEVCFQRDIVDGDLAETGFETNLLSSHGHGETRFRCGCSICKPMFDNLREIATWIMPKDRRPSEYVIAPFDQTLHMDAAHKLRPEVRVTVKIEHRGNKRAPLDDCEWRCLSDMEASLKRLAVSKPRGPGR